MQETTTCAQTVSIEIAAQRDSPGAEIIKLLVAYPREKQSMRYPIEVLTDWERCEGGEKATVSIYNSKTETSYICDCFVGDLSNRKIDKTHKQFLLGSAHHVSGAYKCDTGSVTLNASRFGRYDERRKVSLGQQIIVQAITECEGFG